MSDLHQIGISLVGAFVGVFLAWLWRKVSKTLLQTRLRDFWSFTNKTVAIVFPMYNGPGAGAPKTMAHVEDVLAIAKITRLLSELHQEYRLVDDSRELQPTEDLILICSPKGNKQSKHFAEDVNLPFVYVYDPKCPCFRHKNEEFTAPMDIPGQNAHADIALVAKLPETNPHRTVFLFWGLHGPGTLGAVHFAVERKKMTKIDKSVRKNGGAFLVNVPFRRVGNDDNNGPREPRDCTLRGNPQRFDPKWLIPLTIINMTKSGEQDSAANGSQPTFSEANTTISAAASRR